VRSKRPTFLTSISPKDPPFYHLSPKDPTFLSNLSPKDTRPFFPFVTQRPLFFQNCHPQIPNFTILGSQSPKFAKFSTKKSFFPRGALLKDRNFSARHRKTPLVWCVTERPPPPCQVSLSPKDPSFQVSLSPKNPYVRSA